MKTSRNMTVVAPSGRATAMHAAHSRMRALSSVSAAIAAQCAGTSRTGHAGMGIDDERGRAAARRGTA